MVYLLQLVLDSGFRFPYTNLDSVNFCTSKAIRMEMCHFPTFLGTLSGDDGSALLVRLLDVGMNSRVEFKNRSVKICRGHQTFWYRPLNPKR
jgi:hypothetical protein